MTRLLCLATVLLCLAPVAATAQEVPDAPPGELPFFHDAAGMFPEDQHNALARDARLLQSTGIPTLVYVRETTAQEAAQQESREFADLMRSGWGVESAEGADDGLVLLLSWVPGNPRASTVVFSHGAETFANSGLTPESIQHTIDTSVASLIEQGKPFETLIYLMRETRYTGIYVPPPPPPVEGSAETIYNLLDWAAPVSTVAVALLLAVRSSAFWRTRPSSRTIWSIVGAVMTVALTLWLASVHAQSRTGIGNALLEIALLALACWLWTHPPFTTRHAAPAWRRSVPPTRRLMRQRHQARKKLARASGGNR